MVDNSKETSRLDPSFAPLMRSLALELAIYAPLVTIYFILVLRYATGALTRLYSGSSVVYAIISVAVIVVQGALLEVLTSWLLRRIGLRQ